jgi:hypothetical protein
MGTVVSEGFNPIVDSALAAPGSLLKNPITPRIEKSSVFQGVASPGTWKRFPSGVSPFQQPASDHEP